MRIVGVFKVMLRQEFCWTALVVVVGTESFGGGGGGGVVNES